VYELPGMRLVLSAGGLPDGAALLAMPVAGQSDGVGGDGDGGGFSEVTVTELRLESFPPRAVAGGPPAPDTAGAAPHLLATLSDGTLVAYRAYLPLQVLLCLSTLQIGLLDAGLPQMA